MLTVYVSVDTDNVPGIELFVFAASRVKVTPLNVASGKVA
jgi:hypothetical protein